ncbi:hypothetical protein Tco_1173691 [Tanacetum coccineum]
MRTYRNHQSSRNDNQENTEIVKAKVERKSIALKAKKETSNEECRHPNASDPDHLIGECPKPPKDKNQRAFVGGSWSDSGEEDDEKVKDETCLVAHASSEICLGVDLEPDEWIKDSGCSKHMTGNRKLFPPRQGILGGQICDNKAVRTFSEHDREITKDCKVIGNGYSRKGQKESQKRQNRARNEKDKVKSKPKSVKAKSQPSEENTT